MFCVTAATGASPAQAATWGPAPGLTQVPIWPGAAPGSRPAPDSESIATAKNLVDAKPWRAGVPTEMHLYANSGHAFGLRRSSPSSRKQPSIRR